MNPTTTTHNGLTVPAAAARAGVDATTIRDAISRGELPARERFSLEIDSTDLDAWGIARQESQR